MNNDAAMDTMFTQQLYVALVAVAIVIGWRLWPGSDGKRSPNIAEEAGGKKKKKKKGKKSEAAETAAKMDESTAQLGEKKKKKRSKKKKGGTGKIKELEAKLAELGGAVEEEELVVTEEVTGKATDTVDTVVKEEVPAPSVLEFTETQKKLEKQEDTTGEENPEEETQPTSEPESVLQEEKEVEEVMLPTSNEEGQAVRALPVNAKSYDELIASMSTKPKTHVRCEHCNVTMKIELSETHLRGKKHKKHAGKEDARMTSICDPDTPPTPEMQPIQPSASVPAMLAQPAAPAPVAAPARAGTQEEEEEWEEEEWDEDEYDEEYDEEDEEEDEATQAEADHANYLERMIAMRQKIDGIQGVSPKVAAPQVEEADDEEEVIDGWTHVSGVASPSGVESAPGWF